MKTCVRLAAVFVAVLAFGCHGEDRTGSVNELASGTVTTTLRIVDLHRAGKSIEAGLCFSSTLKGRTYIVRPNQGSLGDEPPVRVVATDNSGRSVRMEPVLFDYGPHPDVWIFDPLDGGGQHIHHSFRLTLSALPPGEYKLRVDYVADFDPQVCKVETTRGAERPVKKRVAPWRGALSTGEHEITVLADLPWAVTSLAKGDWSLMRLMGYAKLDFSFDRFKKTDKGAIIYSNRRAAIPLLVTLLDDKSAVTFAGFRGRLPPVNYRICEYALFILIDLTGREPGGAKSEDIGERDKRIAEFKAWYCQSGTEGGASADADTPRR